MYPFRFLIYTENRAIQLPTSIQGERPADSELSAKFYPSFPRGCTSSERPPAPLRSYERPAPAEKDPQPKDK